MVLSPARGVPVTLKWGRAGLGEGQEFRLGYITLEMFVKWPSGDVEQAAGRMGLEFGW